MKYYLNEAALLRLLARYPEVDQDFARDAIFRCLDGRGPATRYQEEVWVTYVEEVDAIANEERQKED